MVNPTAYHADPRSYNSPHRPPYPQPHLPVEHRRMDNCQSLSFEPQRNMSSEDLSGQRKRIPVACGRCRKRKIRCSGDTGEGSCTNCRNAGALPCLFLRVASHETSLKSEQNPGFSYNLSDSRMHHARGLTTVPTTTQPVAATYAEGMTPYMQNHVDPSSYRGSHAYACGSNRTPLPWGSTYCDAVGDQQDSAYQPHNIYIPTYPPQESRYAPQYQHPPAKVLAGYMDAEPGAYGIGSSAYGAAALAHRPVPSVADVGSGSWFHGVPGSSARDKALPAPPIDRPGLQPESFVRNDSISSAGYSKSSSSPTSSLPEMTSTSSYGTSASYESSPVPSYPAVGSSAEASRSNIWASSSSAAASASSASLDFPPPSVSKYVYHDTTLAAQATAAAARQRGVSPPYAPTPYDLSRLSDERKGSVSLRS